jgi:hypothetical protein
MLQPTNFPVRPRQWPRRLAISFLSFSATAVVLSVALCGWVIYATVPVLVTDGNGAAVNGVVVFGVDRSEFDTVTGPPVLSQSVAGKTSQRDADVSETGRTWRQSVVAWLHRLTHPFGVALVWDPQRPVYTGVAGNVRVPAGWSRLTALSLGDLKDEPGDVYVVETTPGRRGFGSPARIMLWRTSDGPPKINHNVSWHFVETPLSEFLQTVETELGSPVVVDRLGLEEEGIFLNTPVTINVTDVPVLSALRLVLGQFNLTAVIRADSLFVTTYMRGGALEVRLYPVSDLMTANAEREREPSVELDSLIEQTIGPGSWDCVGGQGELALFRPERTLWVNQMQGFHDQIGQVLAALRSKSERIESAKEAIIRRDMAERLVSVDFCEVLLSDAVYELREQVGTWSIVLDKLALGEEGVNSDTPVSLRATHVKLGTALEQLLQPLNLTTIVQNDVLAVTSQVGWNHALCMRLYPVAGLVRNSNDAAALCRRIQAKIEPRAWQSTGGIGSLYYFAPTDCLIVVQTEAVQELVKAFLEKDARERDNLGR